MISKMIWGLLGYLAFMIFGIIIFCFYLDKKDNDEWNEDE